MASRAWLALPVAVFVAAGCLVPLGLLAVFSVFTVDDMDLVPDFSGASWREFFSSGVYAGLIGKAAVAGAITAFVCAAIGTPVAVAMARLPRAWKGVALTALLTPLYTGELVRLYAWRLVLGSAGLLNSFLLWTGIVDQPVKALLFSPFATRLVQVYDNIPFMALAIWVSAELVDPRLVEAARDLGARPIEAFWRVTLPLILPGLAAGSFAVFALAAGDLLTPQIVGGTSGATAMAMIDTLFGTAFDWPMASVMSLALLALLVASAAVATVLASRLRGVRAAMAAR